MAKVFDHLIFQNNVFQTLASFFGALGGGGTCSIQQFTAGTCSMRSVTAGKANIQFITGGEVRLHESRNKR